jgi:hypothetical protein
VKIARKLLASFLLAASTLTAPNKPMRFFPSAASREVPDGGYVRQQCHRSYPDGTNWQGDYVPCRYKDELLKKTHMELPVYIGTSDPVWAREQARALDFWENRLVDMHWYPTRQPGDCALAFVDGTPAFMDDDDRGRAQLPNWTGFQGLIAVNLSMSTTLTPEEKFANAAHELAHVIGRLYHNKAAFTLSSQVYSPALMNGRTDGTYAFRFLSAPEINTIRRFHTLRSNTPPGPIAVAPNPSESDSALLTALSQSQDSYIPRPYIP